MNALRMTRPGKLFLGCPPSDQAAAGGHIAQAGSSLALGRACVLALVTGLGLVAQPSLAQGDLQLKPSSELLQAPSPSTLTLANQPTAVGVPMGTGDQININVFGQPDLTTVVTLDAVGMITLPLIGPVKALGLLPRQLERLVSTRLVEGGYLKEADVVVNVQQTRSRFFSVLGEVVRPGRYPLENTLSLLDALAEAGGATDKAEPVVTLIRGPQDSGSADSPTEAGPTRRFSIDPRKGPDPALATLALRNRDVLFVPAKQIFYVYGEVRSPGVFSIEPGLSLLKALSMAGGLTDRGSERRVVLTRKTDSGLNRESSAELTETIQPGDVIRVKERLF